MVGKLVQFVNCRILRDHNIVAEDLWVRKGKIINPEKVFFDERVQADERFDCGGHIIAPGFIELQINGGYGVDFSYNTNDVERGVQYVAEKLLSHGITSFCPTVVTSPKETYHQILPKIKRREGGTHGAAVLGVHVEGPFISKEKKGAHPEECILTLDNAMKTVEEVYGGLSNLAILTLAPELRGACEVTKRLNDRGIKVSLGHSVGSLNDGEAAVKCGANFITHLFNAMLPFHHRDPGLVGLLTSSNIPEGKTVYFGIIADGTHTHPSALRIAHRAHPDGLVLVTDAISAIGLEDGKHNIGQMSIEMRQGKAYIAGTNTLCGSIATMNECIQFFRQATNCSREYALEVATLHPARVLGIENVKGTLNYDADADFVMLNDDLLVLSTWIAGKCVYQRT